jgi:hypothetical protein
MATAVPEIMVDTIFDKVEAFLTSSRPWSMTLGYNTCRHPLLCLWTEGEKDGRVGNGKIDFLRRRFGDIFLILCTTKEDCQVWELDVKKFISGKCILHCNKDIDGVIMSLRKAKWQKILDIILAFLDSQNDF